VSDGRTREVSRKRLPLGSRFGHRDGGASPPFIVAPPPILAGFGAKIMAEARCDGTSGALRICNKLNRLRDCRGGAGWLARPARGKRRSVLPVRDGLTQVPIRSGVLSLRRAATTESAVIRPVRGFSEGTFSIARVKCDESLSTSMVWQLRSTEGSAQISIIVRSGPMPARANAATTLTLAGNPPRASPPRPAETTFAPLRPSRPLRLAA